MQVCNPSPQEVEVGGLWFEARLGYTARPCRKNGRRRKGGKGEKGKSQTLN
jgi:hypothetical protein